MDPEEIIALLGLEPHPEGGHYRRTWRDPEGAGSAIYFFLNEGQVSHWHRNRQTEIWHHYAGGPLELCTSADGTQVETVVVGSDLNRGQRPQALVPRGYWQSARPLGPWVLCGCSVTPAFDFSGFELAPPGWAPGG
jgi:predicted cupin superfamily sugar epimerase